MADGKRGRPKGSKNSFKLGELKGSYYETVSQSRDSISGSTQFRIFVEPTPLENLTKHDVIMVADGKVGEYISCFVDGKGNTYANVTFDGYKVYCYDYRSIKKKKPSRKENN